MEAATPPATRFEQSDRHRLILTGGLANCICGWWSPARPKRTSDELAGLWRVHVAGVDQPSMFETEATPA